MRETDPFPIPHQGLTPTHQLDWEAMARKLIREVLRLERRERVLISADPYCGGAMLDAVRAEIQRAGGIELATILHWTPALTKLRNPDGTKPEPAEAAAEDAAMAGLFAQADIFLWLQNDWRSPRSTMTIGQSERILESWPGRSVHFHWFHDPGNPDPDHESNKALDLVYQDAVLNLDYAALGRRMRDLRSRMAERELRITTPAGTDIRFRTGARFHVNDGDASRAKAAAAASPRDREEEIPCGALRTIPLRDTVEGVIALRAGFGYPTMGNGLDIDRWLDQGLRFHFEGGRIRSRRDRRRSGGARSRLAGGDGRQGPAGGVGPRLQSAAAPGRWPGLSALSWLRRCCPPADHRREYRIRGPEPFEPAPLADVLRCRYPRRRRSDRIQRAADGAHPPQGSLRGFQA